MTSVGTAPSDLWINLLGGFSVQVGARSISDPEWDLRKAKSLMKLLALQDGHMLHREQVMNLLWPDLDTAAGSNNLHKAVHVARRVLQPTLPPKESSAYLHSRGEFITLDPPGDLFIDVESFRQAAEVARRERSPQLYQKALAMYGGDLLPGDVYEDWSAVRREQLRMLRIELLMELSALHETAGSVAEAIAVLRELTALDPAHEEAVLRLMRLYVKSGARHLALRQYHALRDALHEELDAEPGDAVQHVYHQILSGRAERQKRYSSLLKLSAPGQESPGRAPLSLVGRDSQLRDLLSLVATIEESGCRFHLLAGEAGCGKTRLVAELADTAAERGAITLWGGSPVDHQAAPYGLFITALEGLALRMALADEATPLSHSGHRVTAAIAELHAAGSETDRDESPAHDAWRVAGVVRDCLTSLAREAPVLLVLDDLHMADEAAVFLLDYLIGTLAGVPVLLLGCLRSEDCPKNRPLDRLIARLTHDRRVETTTLPALEQADAERIVEMILGGAVDPQLMEIIFTATSGNPYYLWEAVTALQGRKAIRLRRNRWSLEDPNAPWLGRDSLRHKPAPRRMGIAS